MRRGPSTNGGSIAQTGLVAGRPDLRVQILQHPIDHI
jgi:hypothetical protein